MVRGSTDYLCWLMNQAGVDAEGDDGYLQLCTLMQETDFSIQMDMDENRIGDAEDLRMEWAASMTDNEQEQDWLAMGADEAFCGNCSMMELTVILARNMQYEMMDSEYEAGVGKWFREMLCNCGLDEATNVAFEANEDRVKDILAVINARRFGWDGEGSFFPLAYPQRDQRRIEIIDQMNDYLAENYDIC